MFPDADDRPTYKSMTCALPERCHIEADYVAVLGHARRVIQIATTAHTNPIPMAVRLGPHLFSSRILPSRNGPPPEADAGQLGNVLANAQDVLAAAGMEWPHVTQARFFLREKAFSATVERSWRQHASGGALAVLHMQPYAASPTLRVMLEIIAYCT